MIDNVLVGLSLSNEIDCLNFDLDNPNVEMISDIHPNLIRSMKSDKVYFMSLSLFKRYHNDSIDKHRIQNCVYIQFYLKDRNKIINLSLLN